MEKRKSISIGEGVPEQNGGRASASERECRNRTEEEYQHRRRSAGIERRKSIGIRSERKSISIRDGAPEQNGEEEHQHRREDT